MTTPQKNAHIASSAVTPLLAAGKPVDWWFAFKFNDNTFPGDESKEPNPAIFGGVPTKYKNGFCLNYAYASSAHPALQMGAGSIGSSMDDPLGATFGQIYFGSNNYVLWNDQFYNNPIKTEGSPAGHSKGALTWNNSGEGFVLQVSTPSWPGSGSAKNPRQNDGNTLGSIADDDVLVSQHFFALKLTPADVEAVLTGLVNASVVTDQSQPSIFNGGGPANLVALAKKLGQKSSASAVFTKVLSSGVTLISKPSGLQVPPWQMVSAQLGGVPLRAATWWETPFIFSTDETTPMSCWDTSLGKAGAVQIATTGSWQGKTIGLKGEAEPTGNHAKVGISTAAGKPHCIFGDMNQQGALSPHDKETCASSQNGRGGLFFVLDNPTLCESLTELLRGDSAPVAGTPEAQAIADAAQKQSNSPPKSPSQTP
jgi:deoxyribonuclease II